MQQGPRIVWGRGCSETSSGSHVIEFNEEETEATCCQCALVIEGDDLDAAFMALEESRGGVEVIVGDNATPRGREILSQLVEWLQEIAGENAMSTARWTGDPIACERIMREMNIPVRFWPFIYVIDRIEKGLKCRNEDIGIQMVLRLLTGEIQAWMRQCKGDDPQWNSDIEEEIDRLEEEINKGIQSNAEVDEESIFLYVSNLAHGAEDPERKEVLSNLLRMMQKTKDQ